MAKAKGAAKRARGAKATAAQTITLPELKTGEKYRGFVLDAAGKPHHHVILLAGELESATHEAALKWATKQGGSLPDRAEGALLYANNADGAIQQKWYWLEPQPAGRSDYAWYQGFGYGDQNWGHRSGTYRARAVRRVPVQ